MTSQSAACTETAFTIDTSSIKFGPGITGEAGYELDRLGASRVMVVTDPRMAGSAAVNTATNSLKQANVDFAVFDRSPSFLRFFLKFIPAQSIL